MKYSWQDLPKKKTVFTVRSATMNNLNNGKIIQHYSSNTRIDVVQKCVTEDNTYYRTESAAYNNLNWAFEASAFGLPNEAAPSVPHTNLPFNSRKKVIRRPSAKKQKSANKPALPKDGECKAQKKGIKNKFLAFFKRK